MKLASGLGVLPARLYLLEQTGKVYISDPDNCRLVTSMESISAIGKSTNPMMIMPGQQMKEKHFPKGLNDGIRQLANQATQMMS